MKEKSYVYKRVSNWMKDDFGEERRLGQRLGMGARVKLERVGPE